ncbi:MAG: LOG family protein [Candidatus Eisenbacteria bacterium]|uniref:LOG family protein n=1 Tax=Eiseniibacteriota bacterium TaxID=2212470 RepID=A0A933SAZ7_UNCEI|nr:LOG family protein [Candidatus Eisenbacteria bacterium]
MTADSRRPVVAVFGSSILREDEPAYAEVRALGGHLARRGLAVMTGGYDGAMAAASRGAHEAGGHVIGVTVDLFEKRGPVNPWVLERVHTPTLYARLDHLVRESDAFVAVTGSIGTLTELFLTWTMLAVAARPAAPFVLMGAHWHEWLELHRGPEFIPDHLFRHVQVAETPEETAALVAAGLEAPGGRG